VQKKVFILVVFNLIFQNIRAQNYARCLAHHALYAIDTMNMLYKTRLSSSVLYERVRSHEGKYVVKVNSYDKKKHRVADILRSDSTYFLTDSIFCYPTTDTIAIIDSLGIYDSLCYYKHLNYTCMVIPKSYGNRLRFTNLTTLVLLQVDVREKAAVIIFTYLNKPRITLQFHFDTAEGICCWHCTRIKQSARKLWQ
jgi:hypothetical protein